MINEVVYADADKINTKNKTLGLTYYKGNRAKHNLNSFDRLDTEEMDKDNANTIEIPLKGGIISYNITDIKGVDVMHYFKKKWANRERVTMDVKSQTGDTDSYELQMDNNNEREFLNRFIKKVEFVINAWIQKQKHKQKEINFSQISILPIKSSSNFNKKFVKEELTKLNINGLPCQMVDPNILIKNFTQVKRDEDFIQKNNEFYQSNFVLNDPKQGTVIQNVDNIINRNKATKVIDDNITEINNISKILLNFLNNNKQTKELSTLKIERLTEYYTKYFDLIQKCQHISYLSTIDNKTHNITLKQLIPIKYSKGPSINQRSDELWQMVKPYLRGKKSPITGNKYERVDLCFWQKSDFEIKSIRNSQRLGLKDFFAINNTLDEKYREQEINKMKGTILLIFDDNISGGSTLSEVCFQCKKLGAENIIPITFGKMSTSNTMRGLVINTPKNGYDFSTNQDLSLYQGEKKEKREYIKKENRMQINKTLFYKTFPDTQNKPILNILWLDDVREPYNYFAQQHNSNSWQRNINFYTQNIFSNHNPNFIWVRNLSQFKEYIINHGLPDMISLDHDITPKSFRGKHENGADVAEWLVNYCNHNNLQIPNTYPHSANPNGIKNISNIINPTGKLMESINTNNIEIIKLTENDFYSLIKESVKQIINNYL